MGSLIGAARGCYFRAAATEGTAVDALSDLEGVRLATDGLASLRPVAGIAGIGLGVIRTACHLCSGCGAMAHSRAALMSRYGQVWAYEAKRCGGCDGRGLDSRIGPPV
jgi:hypothetical protein